MIDHVVLDIEIQYDPRTVQGGWDATDKLGVACACLWEYNGARMRIYGPNDVQALRNRINAADRITTFNGWKFDLPCIWGIAHPLRVEHLADRSDDLLRRIWEAQGLSCRVFTGAHKGWRLGAIAVNTLGRSKIGNGAEAPSWFQQGDWARMVNYCADDVALTRDLCDHMDAGSEVRCATKGIVVPPWRPNALTT